MISKANKLMANHTAEALVHIRMKDLERFIRHAVRDEIVPQSHHQELRKIQNLALFPSSSIS